jgi:hypothetical protein
LRWASMSAGKPSERKAREVARAPAWGLEASGKGRVSKTKGVLDMMGSRAGMAIL